MKTDINKLRFEISKIDNEIIKLIKARSLISLKIGKYKLKNNLNILDRKRESEIINNYSSKFKNQDKEYVSRIFRSIFSYSKKIQKTII